MAKKGKDRDKDKAATGGVKAAKAKGGRDRGPAETAVDVPAAPSPEQANGQGGVLVASAPVVIAVVEPATAVPAATVPSVGPASEATDGGIRPGATAPSLPRVEARSRGGRPVTIEDLRRFRVVGEPALAPDGRTVAVAVTTIAPDDEGKQGYRSAIWSVPTAEGDGEPVQMTAGTKRDTSPRWSPDGSRLLFLSNRDTEDAQLWLLPTGGGEARRVTDAENGVADPVWAPDGRHVAFVARVTPPDPNPGSDVKVITEVRYKADGEGFLGGKRRHIFVVDVDREDAAPRQVTEGNVDHRDPAWSPTGRELAFAANRNPEWQFERSSDIWTVVPGAPPRRLTPGDGAFGLPAWSPDGATIACVGHRKLHLEGPNDEIWLVPAAGGEPRSLTAEFDRGVGDSAIGDLGSFPARRPAWTPDGRGVLFLASDRGTTHVFRAEVEGGGVTPLTAGQRRVGAFDLDRTVPGGGRLAVAAADPVTPSEIHLVAAGEPERVLTAFNADLVAETAASLPEPFWVESTGGFEVQGWLLRPVGADGTPKPGRHPAILEIHGGPHGMYGLAYFHEFQVLASRGYAVVFANPRGSTGYGERFTEGLHAAWGENDFPDLMACVDHAIALGGVDPERLGIAGGSYGGYMTNWVIAHTDRFKAAVTQRTISNLESMYGTDDIAVVSLDVEFGGPPWTTDRYRQLSPLTHVERIATPLLILHAEEDHRCPMEQAEQLFLALKRLRREVVLVRFPDESHGLTRSGQPAHREEHMRRLVEWFDGHM